jgi:hypothetical protein
MDRLAPQGIIRLHWKDDQRRISMNAKRQDLLNMLCDLSDLSTLVTV